MFLGIFIGNFRGNEPSENFEEQVPRYIPRNESLGIFRGTCPSVYSEGSFPQNLNPRKIPRNMSLGIFRGMSPSVYSVGIFRGNSEELVFGQLKFQGRGMGMDIIRNRGGNSTRMWDGGTPKLLESREVGSSAFIWTL
ncbi:hypothetical protein DY000_02045124 [Brassica cretica]|uniref:Uncharacterized protein n=1 Tax=Brassica cretica TaxID=69181 RepID=A0ABQ7F5B2_BRACR|nr:hypothetical protein DY000_02045124 [Brassica cretica]